MDTAAPAPDGGRYLAVHHSAEFRELRRRSSTVTLWASVAFFGWWFLGSLLATYAPDFFREKVAGPVNVGLLFVFLSFTFVVTLAAFYLRYARTRLDPLSEEIRADLEGASR